jgi:hypothetical protein
MPALPLDEAGRYVAAAYVVFVILLDVYVSVMARHVGRLRADVRQFAEELRGRDE